MSAAGKPTNLGSEGEADIGSLDAGSEYGCGPCSAQANEPAHTF